MCSLFLYTVRVFSLRGKKKVLFSQTSVEDTCVSFFVLLPPYFLIRTVSV